MIHALRIVHILAAIFWLGAAFTMAAFVLPTARRLGPDASRFMQALMGQSGLPVFINVMALLTVLSGIGLMDFASAHFQAEWFRSPAGRVFAWGGLVGLVAFAFGGAVQTPAALRMAKLSRTIAASGGPPTPEQQAQLARLRDRLAVGGVIGVVLLILAASLMSVARYA